MVLKYVTETGAVARERQARRREDFSEFRSLNRKRSRGEDRCDQARIETAKPAEGVNCQKYLNRTWWFRRFSSIRDIKNYCQHLWKYEQFESIENQCRFAMHFHFISKRANENHDTFEALLEKQSADEYWPSDWLFLHFFLHTKIAGQPRDEFTKDETMFHYWCSKEHDIPKLPELSEIKNDLPNSILDDQSTTASRFH